MIEMARIFSSGLYTGSGYFTQYDQGIIDTVPPGDKEISIELSPFFHPLFEPTGHAIWLILSIKGIDRSVQRGIFKVEN